MNIFTSRLMQFPRFETPCATAVLLLPRREDRGGGTRAGRESSSAAPGTADAASDGAGQSEGGASSSEGDTEAQRQRSFLGVVQVSAQDLGIDASTSGSGIRSG